MKLRGTDMPLENALQIFHPIGLSLRICFLMDTLCL